MVLIYAVAITAGFVLHKLVLYVCTVQIVGKSFGLQLSMEMSFVTYRCNFLLFVSFILK